MITTRPSEEDELQMTRTAARHARDILRSLLPTTSTYAAANAGQISGDEGDLGSGRDLLELGRVGSRG